MIILFIVLFFGVGYAYLNTMLTINGNATVHKNTWDVHFENITKVSGSVDATSEATITGETAIDFIVDLTLPGDFYAFKVDVVNDGTIDAMLSEVLKTGLTTDQEEYIDYTVTYFDGEEILSKDSLPSGKQDQLLISVKYRDDITADDLPNDDQSIVLTLSTDYIQDDGTSSDRRPSKPLLYNVIMEENLENGLMVLDNEASTYVSASTGIDFKVAPSDTNGKGVYVLNGTESDMYPIYYYRGEITNNNVIFAGFCWKIVRTTETGGIKLIYNGVPAEDGTCDNTTGGPVIATHGFNLSNYNAYVGYMYGSPNSSSYDAEHLSTKESNSSSAKSAIDNWYEKYMTNYTNYLEDTVWCNDRSFASNNNGTGAGTSYTYYGAYSRNYGASMTGPSLECVNQNDRFTVNEQVEGRVNGNGALTYPIALLTADELTLAGQGNQGYSANGYLNNGKTWWTMSPGYFNGSTAYNFVANYAGPLKSYLLVNTAVFRPSISLIHNMKYEFGGDGSVENPYIIDAGEKTITIVGNDDTISSAALNRAVAGMEIKLFSISGDNEISSFKMNGTLIEGTSFIMPAEDVVITDITYIKYLYDEVVLQNQVDGEMVLDNEASTYVSASTGIDFAVAPSDTNGKGVYVRNGTESDSYPIYYYRGAVTNNNVIFGGFCWKIVRTTETGGIKLIYNGTPTDGTCNNTGEASQIGTTSFNGSYNYNAYVGYMYGTPNSSTYDAEHLSTKESTSSTIKVEIDSWFEDNLTSYESYFEDTIWCNDRSFASSNTGTGAGTSETYYGSYTRNYGSSMTGPSLECVNQNDRFTVSEDGAGRIDGNGALTYPVALLTADELTLAGNGNKGYSSTSYLTTGQYWWTLSPSSFDGGLAREFYVYSSSNLDYNGVRGARGVRPSISLHSGAQIAQDGDGSVNNPFVVIGTKIKEVQ